MFQILNIVWFYDIFANIKPNKFKIMTKKFYMNFSLLLISVLVLFSISVTKAQTEGTLTFTFTETVPGASKNVLAVWIVDNSGVFVKTKMRFWGGGTDDHLPSWVTNSAKNTVDAITGPTRTASTTPPAFGIKTVVWNGTDVSGITVPDGMYKIYVETAWSNPEPPHNQHSDIIDFAFDKSTETTHITPMGNTYFSDITIDWVPSTVFIETASQNNTVLVYPNPSQGLVNISFKKASFATRILVENINGEVLHQENIDKIIANPMSLDLHQLSNGIYFIEILFADETNNFRTKVIINR